MTPALTRRRDPEAREECWHIYYGDIRAGSITRAIGVGGVELCGWSRGFHPGESTGGSAATFD